MGEGEGEGERKKAGKEKGKSGSIGEGGKDMPWLFEWARNKMTLHS